MKEQEFELKIGTVLKKLMHLKGKSLVQLSTDLDIPKTTLFGYAQNVMPRKASHIKRICNYFSITSDFLLFHQERIQPDLTECSISQRPNGETLEFKLEVNKSDLLNKYVNSLALLKN